METSILLLINKLKSKSSNHISNKLTSNKFVLKNNKIQYTYFYQVYAINEHNNNQFTGHFPKLKISWL